jgi:hypothetical protein
VVASFVGARILQTVSLFSNTDVIVRFLTMIKPKTFRLFKAGHAGELRQQFLESQSGFYAEDWFRPGIFLIFHHLAYFSFTVYAMYANETTSFRTHIPLLLWSLVLSYLLYVDPHKARATVEKCREELIHQRYSDRSQMELEALNDIGEQLQKVTLVLLEDSNRIDELVVIQSSEDADQREEEVPLRASLF